MSVNARKEEYEHIRLFGKPALFTSSRIDSITVPKGFFRYDLRGSDYDPGRPIIIENMVVVNHTGTVLTPTPVTIPEEGFRRLHGKLNFLDEYLTLAEFCEEHGIALAPDKRNSHCVLPLPMRRDFFMPCRLSRMRRWAPSAMSALISATVEMSFGPHGGREAMRH